MAVPIVDRRRNAPKAGALPTALHPVIQLFIRLGGYSQNKGGKILIFLRKSLDEKNGKRAKKPEKTRFCENLNTEYRRVLYNKVYMKASHFSLMFSGSCGMLKRGA
ncbi:MAG: hypothetical protein ACI4O0_06940 [Candidatus Limivicinus sp.]